jgi:hypothetical protein
MKKINFCQYKSSVFRKKFRIKWHINQKPLKHNTQTHLLTHTYIYNTHINLQQLHKFATHTHTHTHIYNIHTFTTYTHLQHTHIYNIHTLIHSTHTHTHTCTPINI